IEGIILEYTLTKGQQFGSRWIINQSAQGSINDAQAILSGEAGAQLAGSGSFSAILNKNNFQAVIDVLSSRNRSEVLAKPQITAINNEQASIRVGDEQQILVQTQTDQGVVSDSHDHLRS
ncbi:MAG: hypothetical protein ABEJ65_00415, partial [bacterium]